MSVSESQKMKRRVRQSKAWRTLRNNKNVEQGGLDPISKKKLTKTCNCHHLDLREENYTKIDNKDNFVLLNKMTHDAVHFFYKYYKDDREILNRLKDILDKMLKINGVKQFGNSTTLWDFFVIFNIDLWILTYIPFFNSFFKIVQVIHHLGVSN